MQRGRGRGAAPPGTLSERFRRLETQRQTSARQSSLNQQRRGLTVTAPLIIEALPPAAVARRAAGHRGGRFADNRVGAATRGGKQVRGGAAAGRGRGLVARGGRVPVASGKRGAKAGRGRGGKANDRNAPVSTEALDAQLNAYMSKDPARASSILDAQLDAYMSGREAQPTA